MVKMCLFVVIVLLLFGGHYADCSVIQRLIVKLEDSSSHPSSDNCTIFKQIEVSLTGNDFLQRSSPPHTYVFFSSPFCELC